MLTMSCVDYDQGCRGYGDAEENYYPDLEDLSEALATQELRENLAGIAMEAAGVYPLEEINTETGELFQRMSQRFIYLISKIPQYPGMVKLFFSLKIKSREWVEVMISASSGMKKLCGASAKLIKI